MSSILISAIPVISTESHHQPVNHMVFIYVKVIVTDLDVLNITNAFLETQLRVLNKFLLPYFTDPVN